LLRGVAALMVVVFHLVVKMQPFGFDGSQVSFLQGGVDIFFVISGFIMVHISHERERSGGQFMADRIIRIVPIYWLLTLLAYFSGADKTRPIGDLFRSLIDGGWTLNLEMYFYLIFAVSLAASREEKQRLAIVVGVLASVVATSIWAPGRYWPFYGNEIVFEFVIGMVLARSVDRIQSIKPIAAWVMVFAGGIVMVLEPVDRLGSRLLSDGLPAGLIVAGAISLNAAGKRVVAPAALLLGSISYALYLSHVLVFEAINGIFGQLKPAFGALVMAGFLVLALVIALLAAWLIYVALERPATRLLKR
jgi:exopolysaccharide production protein ExoZ